MKGLAFVLAVVTMAAASSNTRAAEKIRLAQSSTVTNCMMVCNSQAANCQTACVLPPPAPSSAVATNITTTTNATGNTTCILSCSTAQLACQSSCSLRSPSQ